MVRLAIAASAIPSAFCCPSLQVLTIGGGGIYSRCVVTVGRPQPVGQWCRMKSIRSYARITRSLGTLALALGVLVGWGGRIQADRSLPENASHNQTVSGQHHAEQSSAAWTSPDGHDCAHCPPSECSHAAPCAMAAGVALDATVVSILPLSPHRTGLPSSDDNEPSSPLQPPTPPPQSRSGQCCAL